MASVLLVVVGAVYIVYSMMFIPKIMKYSVHVSLLSALATTPIILGYMGMALSLGVGISQRWWQQLVTRKPVCVWIAPVTLWCLYELFAIPTGHFELKAALVLAVYVFLPVYLATLKRNWADWLIVVVIALPLIYKDWLFLARIPADKGVNPREICSITMFLWSMLVVRRLPGLDFRLWLPRSEIKYGIKMLGLAMLILLPPGVLFGFLKWNPFQMQISLYHTTNYLVTAGVHLLLPLGMYLAVAIPEELVFRGTLQNLLAQSTKRPWLALVIVSILFGLSHLPSNVDGRPISYSIIYGLMSCAAGAIYGYTYMKRGGIVAACVVHALVDSVWLTFFNPK
ncbi:MAG: CPBP family intramembrane glutamic endopeptidase [Armatimonadota bacterium]